MDTPAQVVRPRSGRPRSKPDEARAVRRDPARSHVDGMREGRLTGDGYRPKDFHYVWVEIARIRGGVEYYEMMGYKVVTPDDGIKVTGRFRSRDGQIEMLGHVLMACPMDVYKQIVEYGPGGDTGLARSRQIEKSISNKRELAKGIMRGLRVEPHHMRVVEPREDGGDDDDAGAEEEEA